MNTASLELCRELYELSGWLCKYGWFGQYTGEELGYQVLVRSEYEINASYQCPAYELGYLLRKLPPYTRVWFNKKSWVCSQGGGGAEDNASEYADTPEDAVAKLAIELFKQGILERTKK